MSPKEKANELLEKFHQAMYAPVGGGAYTYTNRAKQCAIIVVDEILMLAPAVFLSDSMYDYWGEVKEILNNSNH